MILVTAIHIPRSRLQYVMEDVIRQKFGFPTHRGLSVLQLVDSEQNVIDDNMYPRLLRTRRTLVERASTGVGL